MRVVGIDPSVIELAYFAGLVDGEGYIGAKRRLPTARNHMTAPKYSLAFSISMTDREPIDAIAGRFGGVVRVRKPRRAGHKVQYMHELENERAAALIMAIRPYLIAKAVQADKALELHALRRQSSEHRTKVLGTHQFKGGRYEGGDYRVLGLSDEFVAKCDALYTELLRRPPRCAQRTDYANRRC